MKCSLPSLMGERREEGAAPLVADSATSIFHMSLAMRKYLKKIIQAYKSNKL